MKNEIITAVNLLKLNEYDLSLFNAKSFSGYPFLHYTSVDKCKNIITGNSFWASRNEDMNDKTEKIDHKYSLFSLCFSNTKSEKVPMWYLYSGINGDGVAIRFTSSQILRLLRSINTIYPDVNNNADTTQALCKGIDFDIEYGWIYYKDSKYRYNYKRKWYEIEQSDSSDQSEVFEENNCFIKNYCWENETEFRILFRVKSKIKCNKIELKFPENWFKKTTIILGPEMPNNDVKEFNKIFDRECKNVYKSNLYTDMSLVERNKDKIMSFLENKTHNWNLSKKEKDCITSSIDILKKHWK